MVRGLGEGVRVRVCKGWVILMSLGRRRGVRKIERELLLKCVT